MSKKKELDLEKLEKVTGGMTVNGCPYFIQALGKPYVNECGNCFYYNKDKNGDLKCTNPNTNNQ